MGVFQITTDGSDEGPLQAEESWRPGRREKILLALTIAAIAVVTAVRLSVTISRHSRLNLISGICIGQAVDLSQGVFYRPVLSEEGYGGTRYMPLHFVLHAALMRALGGPIAAGFAISLFSAAALCAGTYLFLRVLRVPRVLAGSFAVFWLATGAGQFAVSTIRMDLLAAALNVWGLFFSARCLTGPGRDRNVYWAAAAFVLAFFTKLVSVFGLIASALALVLAGRWKSAAKLCVSTSGGILLAAAIVNLASSGRFLESMAACAWDGKISELAAGPLVMFKQLKDTDPVTAGIWFMAFAALVAGPVRELKGLPALSLASTGILLSAALAMPGVSFNHLVDLHVAAFAVIAVYAARTRSHLPLVVSLVAVMLTANALVTLAGNRRYDTKQRRADAAAVLGAVGDYARPMLSEDAIVAIYAGERPFMLDSYGFRILSSTRPAMREDLLGRLERRQFGCVVVQSDPLSEKGRDAFSRLYFCDGFTEALLRNYSLAATSGEFFAYVPKAAQSEGGPK